MQIGTGVIGVVAQKRKMLHVSNLGQQRAYAAAQRRQMVKAGRGEELGDAVPVPGLPNAESQIAIPLLIRDELIGVFSIESPVPAHVQRARARARLDRRQSDRERDPQRAALRGAPRAAEALQAANASLEARVAERTAALERELRVAAGAPERARAAASRVRCSARAPRSARCETPSPGRPGRAEPLLLVGPPGAGKEAVAHAVHGASGRTARSSSSAAPSCTRSSRHAG